MLHLIQIFKFYQLSHSTTTWEVIKTDFFQKQSWTWTNFSKERLFGSKEWTRILMEDDSWMNNAERSNKKWFESFIWQESCHCVQNISGAFWMRLKFVKSRQSRKNIGICMFYKKHLQIFSESMDKGEKRHTLILKSSSEFRSESSSHIVRFNWIESNNLKLNSLRFTQNWNGNKILHFKVGHCLYQKLFLSEWFNSNRWKSETIKKHLVCHEVYLCKIVNKLLLRCT